MRDGVYNALCVICGQQFWAWRIDAQCCSAKCRMRKMRDRRLRMRYGLEPDENRPAN